jgi:arsenate reductase (thioredoxin)
LKVIFACVHNAGRSQMAAAYFNHFAAPLKARAVSAGTQPAAEVHAGVRDAMKEDGIDLSQSRPQFLTEALVSEADLLVTMGCGEACPVVPGLRRHDWPLPDPKGKSSGEVAKIREEIKVKVQQLVIDLDVN